MYHWLHEVVWREATMADPDGSEIQPDSEGSHCVIVQARRSEIGQRLCHEQSGEGARCEVVDPPALEGVLTSGRPVTHLVFIGDSDGRPAREAAELEAAQEEGVLALLEVSRMVMSVPLPRRPARMYVVSFASQFTGIGRETLAPEQAPLAGLAFALTDELALTCTAIDLDPSEPVTEQIRWLKRELAAGPQGALVAWRRGRRLVRQLVPLVKPHEGAADASRRQLRRGDVYLITGGAGGLGSGIARWMARQSTPVLLLVGRKSLKQAPERGELVAELRRAGARAEYLRADVTNPDDVEDMIFFAVSRYGAVNGVIHAAGLVHPGRLTNKTTSQFSAGLASKTTGSLLLFRELQRQKQDLDFFVTFSSISSIIPGLGGGLGDYVAANAFLDAFAHAQHALGHPLVNINWTAWTDKGMGAHPMLLQSLANRGIEGISTGEAVQVFEEALRLQRSQLVVVNPAAATLMDLRSGSPRPSVIS